MMLTSRFRESENLIAKRRKQINTLKIFNANVSEIKEDYEYRVDFNSGGHTFSILVALGPEFPLEKPILQLIPNVHHPWVNDNGEITGAPGLLNFTEHSDLGRVVQAIVRELVLRPPPLQAGTTSPPCMQRMDASGPISPNNYGYSSTPPGVHGFPSYFSPPGTHTQGKHLSIAFPELNSLSLTDLELLNQSPDCLDEFIDSLPVMKEIDRKIDELISGNEQVASETLSKEQCLQDLRLIVAKKIESVQQLKAKHDTLSQQYQRLADRYSPQSIREEVKRAAVQSDEDSELMAEQFLSGEVDLDTFLTEYTHKRLLSYCRKTKEEKLSCQLKELQKAGY